MEIHDALKRFRRSKALTQMEVTQAIGIPRQSYTLYESGNATPSAKVIKKLSEAFGVSSDYLLGLTDTPVLEPADVTFVKALERVQQVLSDAGKDLQEIRQCVAVAGEKS